jgi:hypothetical protein
MSINDLANTPQEVCLNGTKLKVSRLSIAELYGPSEAKILSEYKSNMIAVASCLAGKEKMEYLTQATREMPKGSLLMTLAQEQLSTPEGYFELLIRALNKHQVVNENEVFALISKASDEEKAILLAQITGSDVDMVKKEIEGEDKKK